MRFLYTLMFYCIQPIIIMHLWLQGRKFPAYRQRWKERYGYSNAKIQPHGLLLHSVSVGETMAAIPLIRAIQYQYPNLPITVTSMTPRGSEVIQKLLGKDINHIYFPYDLPHSINRFLNTVKPNLVIIMETELWPNTINILYQKRIPLIIANARLSEKSSIGYKKLGALIKNMLACITLIAVQNSEDAKRFIDLGFNPSNLVITGSLKFDITLSPEIASKAVKLRYQWASKRPVWIASSTHKGEEDIILRIHHRLLKYFPTLLLIIAPRHPERFKYICKLVCNYGLNFILRSTQNTPTIKTHVVIADTMGELMLLYGIADLAFVGGSLIKKGGHNPLEPAAHAIPIIVGPYVWNFKKIYSKLEQGKGLIKITDEFSLEKEVINLLQDNNYRKYYGIHAGEIFHQNKGALQRLLPLLNSYLSY